MFHPSGRVSKLPFILKAFICALGLLYFIRREKAVSGIHCHCLFLSPPGLLVLQVSFPSGANLPAGLSIALMVVIGEHLRMWTELTEISLNSIPKSNV